MPVAAAGKKAADQGSQAEARVRGQDFQMEDAVAMCSSTTSCHNILAVSA